MATSTKGKSASGTKKPAATKSSAEKPKVSGSKGKK
jgi:hypothetical protein